MSIHTRAVVAVLIAASLALAAPVGAADDASAPPVSETAVRIVDQPFTRTLLGVSGHHEAGKPYGPEIIALLDQVWPKVKQPGFKTTGINHLVYGADDALFAGVELTEGDAAALGLERRELKLPRYVTYKHVGAYAGLPAAWKRVEAEIVSRGLTRGVGGIEIYGHWTEDESKLETDILIPLAPAK